MADFADHAQAIRQRISSGRSELIKDSPLFIFQITPHRQSYYFIIYGVPWIKRIFLKSMQGLINGEVRLGDLEPRAASRKG